jgi:hypothetical protein
MVGNVLASFPLNKSKAKEPLDEEPIPLVRRSVRPSTSERLSTMKLGDNTSNEVDTARRTMIPEEDEIELVAPGMFRLPVSDDDETRKLERPERKDAIPPPRLPASDIESVQSFELIVEGDAVEEEPATLPAGVPHDTPADWEDSAIATAELKSPEELRGADVEKSCESIHSVDIIEVAEDEEDLKSPEELRRSTRPPMTGEIPEDQPLFSLMPSASKDTGDGDSSVNRSLEDIRNLEEDRQFAELEAEEQRETEAKRLEFLRVLAERRKQMEADEKAKKEAAAKAAADAAAKARAAADEAKKAEEAMRAKEEKATRQAETDETVDEIIVEIEDGILWEDDHTTYRLTDEEMAGCEHALPNRKRRYILPVPDEDTEFAALIKTNLAGEEKVELAGKSYYIMDREFAEAKIVARVGNGIHVWPSAMTEYKFLGKIGVDTPEYDKVSWPNDFFLTIRPEEKEMVDGLLFENRPMLLHPVPPPYTKNPYNMKIMNDCDEIPIVDIDGREYYVLEPETMSAWREIVLNLEDVKMVSRKGDKISVWDKRFNGYSIFSCEGTCHLASYGEAGAPLIPRGHETTIEPYNAEAVDIATVFMDGERNRHLYPMPERISAMDASSLHTLMMIASEYVATEKHSPLISLKGRWYLALEYPTNGTREASYENGVVRILKEKSAADGMKALKDMMERKREESEPPIVKLPMDPRQRVGLLTKFPEHAVRYLLLVEHDLKSEVPDVWVKNGDGVARYLVHEKEMPGSFAVVRVGDEISPRRK